MGGQGTTSSLRNPVSRNPSIGLRPEASEPFHQRLEFLGEPCRSRGARSIGLKAARGNTPRCRTRFTGFCYSWHAS